MSHRLLVMPDDTVEPVLAAIRDARKTIRVKMFLFSHRRLIAELIEARKRGVQVRVMLNPARRSGKSENQPAHSALLAAGVDVIDTSPEFEVTHEKSMVIDDQVAFIKSFNWELKNLTETRDYAVVTTRHSEVEEIIRCFDADWHRRPFEVDQSALLIWCTANGRDRIARFIDAAQHTLFVQNERYQDPVIIEHLVRARMRGVNVHAMARPPHKLKQEKLVEAVSGLRIMNDVGIKVHKLKHLTLHGKMLLADHSRAIVGSINLAPGSFDSRRELAIEVHSADVVERLRETAHRDWQSSHPLDLTDEGLLAEMKEHAIDASDQLALHTPRKRASHKKH